MQQIIKVVKCIRCGFSWNPRVENPRQCPYCHSERWNVPYKREWMNTGRTKFAPQSQDYENVIRSEK